MALPLLVRRASAAAVMITLVAVPVAAARFTVTAWHELTTRPAPLPEHGASVLAAGTLTVLAGRLAVRVLVEAARSGRQRRAVPASPRPADPSDRTAPASARLVTALVGLLLLATPEIARAEARSAASLSPDWAPTVPERSAGTVIPVPTITPAERTDAAGEPTGASRHPVELPTPRARERDVDPDPGDEPDQVVVRRGDTLWSIAARRLGAGATAAEIAHDWPRWYQANRELIGPDPDRILPGQRLRPPAPH